MGVCCRSVSRGSVFMSSGHKRMVGYGLAIVMQYSLYVIIRSIFLMKSEKVE